MKKSAIAVAVAAVLAAPVALADVQISGQLQTQVVNYGGDSTSTPDGLYLTDGGMSGKVDSGNWGALNVVATEDLGDGMKALAKYAFNIGTSSQNAIGTREAYVGLAGNFGAVLAGRLNHPYKTSTVAWDPFLATFAQARGNYGVSALGHGSEINNALAYAGTFGSVKVVAAMVVDETAETPATEDSTTGNHAYSFSVNAPVGPVEVAVAYIDVSEFGGDGGSYTAQNDKTSATKLGVKWVSGDITVAGQYEAIAEGVAGDDGSIMYVTGSYKMGNNTVSASYGMHSEELNGGSDEATYMAIGLNHAMSKNTSAFVGYRASDNGTTDESAFGAALRVKF